MTDGLPDFRDAWYGNPLFEGDGKGGGPDLDTEGLARLGRANKDTEQTTVQCPQCGEEFGNLPNHLRRCDGSEEGQRA